MNTTQAPRIRASVIACIAVFSLLFTAVTHAGTSAKAKPGEWWNQPYPETFDSSQLKIETSRISVDGNRLINEAGETIILRGVNFSDPDKLKSNRKWKKAHFAQAKAWGANVIRLPVHPTAWQKRGKTDYLALLDQAVVWANELDMYLIIDWHSIGNLKAEIFQHPMYNTSLTETREFWRQIAHRYQGVNTIAVYELFNEPTTSGGKWGSLSWDEWRQVNEELIAIIYAHDRHVIPLVGGFNWAYDLSEAGSNPIRAEGIAYAAHPYPQKSKKPIAEKPQDWDKSWGYMAKKYPILATEIGWMQDGQPGAHIPVIDDGSYGPAIIDYMNKHGVSWTAWCFDPDWAPQMISDWKYTPTEQGEFFRKVMLEENP